MSSILIRRANIVYSGGGSRLPSGYTELAYIKTDGSAYIDTGIKLTEVDKLVGSIAFESISGGNNTQYVAGCRIASSSSATAIGFALYNATHGGFTYFPGAWPANSVGVALAANQAVSFETYISTDAHSFKVDGTVKNDVTATVNKGTSTRTLFLFGLHTASSITYCSARTRIYSMNMYFNGSKIAEYVPAMRDSDSEVGFYDLVGETFLTNAGSGSFSYGTL